MSVNGHRLRDIIDWQWHGAADSIELAYVDAGGDEGIVRLERDPGEFWGFSFEGAVFDEVKTCRNACGFCFMRQLPQGMRPALSLRDDDFRLSFLQGTFVTCSNIDAHDEARIIEQHISPLHVSLHAVSPEVRHALIGCHAAYGLEVCERLLEAGIRMYMQIVLVPEVNDGEELRRTLAWAYRHPGILSIGIVPLGFTKHQSTFDHSYNDPEAARQVLSDLLPFQERGLEERGTAWVFPADEFYRNAYGYDLLDHLPADSFYGDYDLFEDGIGMIRSCVDSWEACKGAALRLASKLAAASLTAHYVIGYAQREFLYPLLAQSPLHGLLVPLPVQNDFFGGNVDVTGLLTAKDILAALDGAAAQGAGIQLALLPKVIFNADGVTLDDMSLEDMQNATDIRLAVVSCNPAEYLEEIAALIP